jgi:hypothetical protein
MLTEEIDTENMPVPVQLGTNLPNSPPKAVPKLALLKSLGVAPRSRSRCFGPTPSYPAPPHKFVFSVSITPNPEWTWLPVVTVVRYRSRSMAMARYVRGGGRGGALTTIRGPMFRAAVARRFLAESPSAGRPQAGATRTGKTRTSWPASAVAAQVSG